MKFLNVVLLMLALVVMYGAACIAIPELWEQSIKLAGWFDQFQYRPHVLVVAAIASAVLFVTNRIQPKVNSR